MTFPSRPEDLSPLSHPAGGYRPEIDGLRALAVMPVLFYHAGFDMFRGGYAGVDVFFVISGYLITLVILRAKERGTFTMRDFYERRARCILPALFTVIAGSFAIAAFAVLPWQMPDIVNAAWAAVLFAANIFYWQDHGYFAAPSEMKPFIHTWSLSVEEQFYVLYPLALLAIWRFARRWQIVLIATAGLISFAAATLLAPRFGGAAFYLLPTRGWELLIGAWAAASGIAARGAAKDEGSWIRRWSSGWRGEALGLTGLAMVAGSMILLDEDAGFPGPAALWPTLGTVLIILFAQRGTLTARILSVRGAVAIGLVSYSLYLWHQPLFAFARLYSGKEPATWVLVTLIGLSMVLAAASWKYVEQPWRDRQRFRGRSCVFAVLIILSGMGAVTLAVRSGAWMDGWMGLQTPERAVFAKAIAARADHRSYADPRPTHCRFTVELLEPDTERRLAECARRHGPGYAIIGDSHARDTFGIVLAGSDEPFLFAMAKGGCQIATIEVECGYRDLSALLARRPDLFAGIVHEEAAQHLTTLESTPDGDPQSARSVDTASILASHAYLRRLSRHAKVAWMEPRFEPGYDDRHLYSTGCGADFEITPAQRRSFQQVGATMAALAANSDRISIIDQNRLFDLRLNRDMTDCLTVFWADGDHLNAAGEARLGGRTDLLIIVFGAR